jgi:hypothetical protein
MKAIDWGGIIFFACFLFSPLLKAVGPVCTTVIICIGLLSAAVVRLYAIHKGVPIADDDPLDDIF